MDEIEIIGEVVRPQKRKRGRPPNNPNVVPTPREKKPFNMKRPKGRPGRRRVVETQSCVPIENPEDMNKNSGTTESVIDIDDGRKGSGDGTPTSSLTTPKHSGDSDNSGQQQINGNDRVEFENKTVNAVSSTTESTTQETCESDSTTQVISSQPQLANIPHLGNSTGIVLPSISSLTSKSAVTSKNPSTSSTLDLLKDPTPTACSSENSTEGSSGSKLEMLLERKWKPVKQVASLASEQGQELDLVEFLAALSGLKQENRILEENLNDLKQRRDQLTSFNEAINAPIEEEHTQEHEQNIHDTQSKESEENQNTHTENYGENNNDEPSPQYGEIIQNGCNKNEHVSLEPDRHFWTVSQFELPVLFSYHPQHPHQQMISGPNSSPSTDTSGTGNEVSNYSQTQPEQSASSLHLLEQSGSSSEQPDYSYLGVLNFSMQVRMENAYYSL